MSDNYCHQRPLVAHILKTAVRRQSQRPMLAVQCEQSKTPIPKCSSVSVKPSPCCRQDADPRPGAAGRPFPASLQPVLQSGLCHCREGSLPVLHRLLPTVRLRRGTLLLPLV